MCNGMHYGDKVERKSPTQLLFLVSRVFSSCVLRAAYRFKSAKLFRRAPSSCIAPCGGNSPFSPSSLWESHRSQVFHRMELFSGCPRSQLWGPEFAWSPEAQTHNTSCCCDTPRDKYFTCTHTLNDLNINQSITFTHFIKSSVKSTNLPLSSSRLWFPSRLGQRGRKPSSFLSFAPQLVSFGLFLSPPSFSG